MDYSVVCPRLIVILTAGKDPRAKRSAAQLPLVRLAHKRGHSDHPIRLGPRIVRWPIALRTGILRVAQNDRKGVASGDRH